MRLFYFLLLFPPLVYGTWRIAPIRVELSPPRQSTSSVTIYNEGKDPLAFTVKAYEWRQDQEGKDVYEETKDLIVFPKNFVVAPKDQRVIRIGVKNVNPAKERTYRVFVENMPREEAKNLEGRRASQVRIVVRFGVPVFVKPLKEEVNWRVKREVVERGQFIVELYNAGNVHIKVDSIEIVGFDSQDKKVFSENVDGWYILAGASRTFTHKLKDCERLSYIKFSIKGVNYEGIVPVDKNSCAF